LEMAEGISLSRHHPVWSASAADSDTGRSAAGGGKHAVTGEWLRISAERERGNDIQATGVSKLRGFGNAGRDGRGCFRRDAEDGARDARAPQSGKAV